MTTFLVLCLGGYAALVAALYAGQRALMYYPDATVPEPADHEVPDMTVVKIPVGEGIESLAWWHPPTEPTGPIVVYFHGNAGHIGERGYKARAMIDAGYGVLLAGYRYNAGAGGKPSEPTLIADGATAMRHVLDLGYGKEQLVLYGESLGSGIAVALAAEHDVAGLILETPYSSVADVAQSRYWYTPAKWLIWDSYDSMARIGRVRAPILLFHGTRDETIPIRFARLLHEAAPEPKEAHFFPGGAHTDLYDHGAARLVIDFLERRAATAPVRGAQ
ncbi:MAG: alpha/beta hydrolase [Rhodospirillales bacterium]|nr:MAG: alpha/beta hydrolase [Rhodospirillales bacterium]